MRVAGALPATVHAGKTLPHGCPGRGNPLGAPLMDQPDRMEQTQSTNQPVPATPATVPAGAQPARPARLHVLGLLLTLGAVPAYLLLLDIAWLRASGFAAFAMMFAGVVVGMVAARREGRRWVRIAAGFNVMMLALGALAFFVLAKLPAADPVQSELTQAIEFTLPDERGEAVSLRSMYERGPTLLVFYRGHW